jgi:SpoVK/Ycf46/Vps4 family AAA+-type ATPase
VIHSFTSYQNIFIKKSQYISPKIHLLKYFCKDKFTIMSADTSPSPPKPFVPKQIFLAHEFFLKGIYFDQQQQFDKAREFYIRSSKIFSYLINAHPDMTLFELWVEQARLAIDRVKQIDLPQFKGHNSSNLNNATANIALTKADNEEQELKQRVLRSRLVPNANLSWNDVIGLDEVVEQLYDTVYLPLRHPELLEGNITAYRTALLFGPPGCGKSHLIRVLTSQIDIPVYNISAANLLSKWFGESQKMIRALYEVAWKTAPSIIFIDEFDGLFGSSATSAKGDSDSSSTMVQIQKELQQYMDGLHTPEINQTVTITATNFPWHLQDSQIRRFDRVLYVPPPTPEVILHLLNHLLKGISHNLTPTQLKWLAHELRGYTPSEVRKVAEDARLRLYKPSMGIRSTLSQINHKNVSSSTSSRVLSLKEFKVSLPLIQPLLRFRGREGVGTIRFRQWNDAHGQPKIDYPIQPWERPGYHPSDDPNPIHLEGD